MARPEPQLAAGSFEPVRGLGLSAQGRISRTEPGREIGEQLAELGPVSRADRRSFALLQSIELGLGAIQGSVAGIVGIWEAARWHGLFFG